MTSNDAAFFSETGAFGAPEMSHDQAVTGADDGQDAVAPADDTKCFLAGTRIMTVAGQRPVEDLALGDLVVLHDGETAPVVFIGRRSLTLAAHGRPDCVRPVRIPAGALGENVPGRDLLVSPDHAMYLDGVLVPAKELIDGVMIRREQSLNRVTYYHVELPRHGILLAEGAAAESFLNVGHRGMFDNADEPVVLQTALMHRRREVLSVAPLVTGGPALATIRAGLHARVQRLGYRVIGSAAVALLVDNELLLPTVCTPGEAVFELKANAARIVLVSDMFTPAETDPSSADRRVLGIAVTLVVVDGAAITPEAAFWPEDLHRREADERASWTRGPARMLVPAGTRRLALRIAGWPRKWRLRDGAEAGEGSAVDARKRA